MRRILATALVLGLLGLACAPESKTPAAGPNVVVIVLDTVRPDYLSAYGAAQPTSPYLAKFAAQGTRYDRAWSTSPWTLPAHASLFSGTLPPFHRASQSTEHIAADVPLLAERLRAAGYQTVALTNNNWISHATGLDRGFDSLRDDWNIRERRRAEGEKHPTVQALKEWFQRGRKADKPFFLFVNLIDAHMPYLPHWPGDARDFFGSTGQWEDAVNRLFPDTGMALLTRNYALGQPPEEADLERLRNLYRGAIHRADSITAALMAQVDANSDPANTIVFVLSDHGENLGEHGQLSHVFNLYEANLRIALLARGPGFTAGAQETRPVQITDVYPTILRALKLEPEPGCVGLDLHGELPAQRLLTASLERPVMSLGSFPEAVRQSAALARFDRTLECAILGNSKQILGSDGSCERYDLGADPGELHPLERLPGDAEQATSDAIARTRAAWVARAAAEIQGNATTDEKTRAGLKNLGYTADDK
ncbi:MAG: sulfatase [Planctomycetes bacterium]|nr:sulfatase [Planctomycetota bacterium]